MATEDHQHKYSMSCTAFDETRPDLDMGCKEKARKSNRRGSSAQKKKPQRGMGVAQLERLRLQERWKMMTEIPPLDSLNNQTQFHYHYPNNFSLSEPIPSVPVMHGPGHYGVPSVAAAAGFMGLDQGLVYQRHGNGGSGCGSCHVLMDPYRIGDSSSVFETSKELSSIPKLQQQWPVVPERCDFCFKKKRFNEDNTGFNGYGFNGGIKSSTFDVKAARSAFQAGHHNLNEGLQVVAVHRNGSKSSMGRSNVVMQYEFFPDGKGGGGGRKSTSSKELGLPAEAEAEASVAVVGGGEASYFTTCAYNNNKPKAGSNSIDLSLKLSY